MNMALLMQRARTNHQPHVGPGTTWIDAYLAVGGVNKFAFEFNNNLLDSSGNGHNASAVGTITYTGDDPAPLGGNCANVTGGQYANIPKAANVAGNTTFTVIGIVRVAPSGFGNNILWMGGGDSGSNAISLSFLGTAAAPQLACDSARGFWGSYAFPAAMATDWMTAIIEYTPGTMKWYVAARGASGLTLLGTKSLNVNVQYLGGNGNWLFQWNGIRRYIGKCAFVGLKQGVLTTAEKNRFIIPT